MNALHRSIARMRIATVAVAVLLLPTHAWAQMDPDMQMPMPMSKQKPAAAGKPAPAKQPTRGKAAEPAPRTGARADHAATGRAMDAMPPGAMPSMEHAAAQAEQGASPLPGGPREPIPAVTDADRAAAFPQVAMHAMHDDDIQSFVRFDRFEAWNANNGAGLEWEGSGWVGTDLDRLWIRSEGERSDGRLADADLEVLYGHSIAAWWDVLAGVRHDFKPGAAQDFATIGVAGVAPGKFDVKATAYIGTSGQVAARFEADYDLLLTNRLVLQPLVELNFHGREDARRGIGSGLGTVEAGLRLRYEITRRFAPYVGIVRERAYGGTAGFRRGADENVDDTRLVAGLRFWF